MGKVSILAIVLVAALSTASGPLAAAEIKCAADEHSVPDERPEGGNLCLSQAEWEKAKKICETLEEKDPLQCTCQDAGKVGACGD